MKYDVVIIGTGPAALGAAFELPKNLSILMIDKEKFSSGGLRNDCKMNFSPDVGFPIDYWDTFTAIDYLDQVKDFIKPTILPRSDLRKYQLRVQRFPGVNLLAIDQAHYGTDGGKKLIQEFILSLHNDNVEIWLDFEVKKVSPSHIEVETASGIERVEYDYLVVAPGRNGFHFGQQVMNDLHVPYVDNSIDVGFRIETLRQNYSIVNDYYDPKFLFPCKTRTFCTNSGKAFVVQEKTDNGYIVNGHAYSSESNVHANDLVNFALLKTLKFTSPLASGQAYAEEIIKMTMLAGGGKPIMQRVGDFRLGKRTNTLDSDDYFNFEPTLKATPGDVSMVCPAKVLRDVWKSMKILDSIIPGVLNPSTVMYFPEIKFYANKPRFINDYFMVSPKVALIGDGFGTSRGIVSAWASGIRAAKGILREMQ